MSKCCLVIAVLVSLSASAEYRVFTLQVKNSKTLAERTFKSTLDPEQYKTIYPLNPDESISYVETWRCRGNQSGLRPLCDNPNTGSPSRL